jgi:hypothetical protein
MHYFQKNLLLILYWHLNNSSPYTTWKCKVIMKDFIVTLLPIFQQNLCVLGTFTTLFASCYIALVIKSYLIFSSSIWSYNCWFKSCLHSCFYNHFIKLCVQRQGCKVCVQVCAKKWQWKTKPHIPCIEFSINFFHAIVVYCWGWKSVLHYPE